MTDDTSQRVAAEEESAKKARDMAAKAQADAQKAQEQAEESLRKTGNPRNASVAEIITGDY